MADVTIAPHPLKTAHYRGEVEPGSTIAGMLAQLDVPESLAVYVEVNARPVPRAEWGRCRPGPQDVVVLRVLPGDSGGDKDPVRTFLTIAVIAASIYVSAGAGGTLVAGGVWSSVGAAAVAYGGMYLVNQIAPPPSPSDSGGGVERDDQPAITGTRNRMRKYGAVPRIFGRAPVYPDFAAEPYTEIVGNDQWLRMAFCVGYGPLNLYDHKIGEDPISGYEHEMEVCDRTRGDPYPTLFTNDVASTSLSTYLEQSGDNAGTWHTHTTQPGTDEISLDIRFNGLMRVDSDGDKFRLRAEFEVQYRPLGGSTWTDLPTSAEVSGPASAKVPEAGFLIVTRKRFGVFLLGIRWKTGAPDQYEVRIRRNATWNLNRVGTQTSYPFPGKDWQLDYCYDSTGDGNPDTCWYYRREADEDSAAGTAARSDWITLRSVKYVDPSDLYHDAFVYVVIRIKATDQLRGVLDRYRVTAQALLETWDAGLGQWTGPYETRSPAWAYAEIMRGAANKRALADAQIGIDEIDEWGTWCLNNGRVFDYVFSTQTTVFEALKMAAAAGRASFLVRDGKYGVLQDVPRSTPTQMIAPGINAWAYEGQKPFTERPDGLKVRFINAIKGYKEDEHIVYEQGEDASTAQTFQTLRFPGVTDPELIAKDARYHMATNRLRPEIHKVDMWIDAITCERGDLVLFREDVMLVGLASGRLTGITTDGSGNVTSITTDTECPMEAGKEYGVWVRTPDTAKGENGLVHTTVTTDPGDQTTLTLSPAIPAADAVADGDGFAFGENGLETRPMLVQSIRYKGELTGEVRLIDYGDEIGSPSHAVYDAEDNPTATYDPGITLPPGLNPFPPPKPVITEIESDEGVLIRAADGSLQPRIRVAFYIPTGGQTASPEWVEVRFREADPSIDSFDGPDVWTAVDARADAGEVYLEPVEAGVAYEIEGRTVSGGETPGIYSEWTATQTETVVGASTPPPAVTGLTATTANWISAGSKSYGVRLKWEACPVIDLKRYEIRSADANWGQDDDQLLARPLDEVATLPVASAGTHTFYAKPVDTAGNYATTAASVQVTITAPTVSGLTAAFDGPNVVLGYSGVEEDFPIQSFEIRRGADTWAASQLVAVVQSTEFSKKADWVNAQYWWVAANDAAGNQGAPSQIEAVVQPPAAPTNFETKVFGEKVLFYWDPQPRTLPIDHFELWRHNNKDATFGDTGTEFLNNIDGTFGTYTESQSGTFAYWTRPVDSAGNKGPVAQVAAFVDDPPDFVLQNEFRTDWTGPRSNVVREAPRDRHRLVLDGNGDYVAISGYAYSAVISAMTVEAWARTSEGSGEQVIASFDASEYWRLRVNNGVADMVGEGTAVDLTGATYVADGDWHHVAVSFDGAAGTATLYVDGTQEDQNTGTAANFGDGAITRYGFLGVGSESSSYNENTGPAAWFDGAIDEFRLWSIARTGAQIDADKDHNLDGTQTGLEVYYRLDSSAEGTVYDQTGNGNDGELFGNAYIARPAVTLVGPFDTSETWEDHFVGTGTTSSPEFADMDALIAAGYTEYLQPSETTGGYYEEVFDVGAVLTTTRATLSYTSQARGGSPTITPTISVKAAAGDPWTDYADTEQVAVNNVRFVKVRLDITPGNDYGLAAISDLKLSLTVRRKTDEGVATVSAGDSGGTTVSLNEAFLDLASVIAQPVGANSYHTATDWTDPNPVEFKVWMWDDNGNRVSGDVSWQARGY